MWDRIYNLVGSDKKNAPIIGSYLKLVANHKGHWHKMGAEIVGWSTNPKGIGKTLYEYEHAMPCNGCLFIFNGCCFKSKLILNLLTML